MHLLRISHVFLVFTIGLSVSSDPEHTRDIQLYFNKVWRYPNYLAFYPYMILGFCTPSTLIEEYDDFEHLIRGDTLIPMNITVNIPVPINDRAICSATLTSREVDRLKHIIEQQYVYEIVIGNVTSTARFGLIKHEHDELVYYLITHLRFTLLAYNNTIRDAQLDSETDLYELDSNAIQSSPVTLKVSVNWVELTDPLLGGSLTSSSANTHHIPSNGWFRYTTLINALGLSCISVAFLISLYGKISRAKFSAHLPVKDPEMMLGFEDDTGWKLLHGDVFRSPSHRLWLCAMIGSGANYLILGLELILWLAFRRMNHKGFLTLICFVMYLVATGVAGYISGSLYRRLGGKQWIFQLIAIVLLYMGPIIMTYSILYCICTIHRSSAVMPFKYFMKYLTKWFTATIPALTIGVILGRRTANKYLELEYSFPCKTNRLAREIPQLQWKQSPRLYSALCGLIPASAIFPEMFRHFVSILLSAHPNRFLLVSGFILMSLLAVALSLLITYKQLSDEDYRWWWRSFVSGGSVGVHLLIFATIVMTSSKMTGLLQCALFLGYFFIIAWAVSLITGFMTFFANYAFIVFIYKNIKSD